MDKIVPNVVRLILFLLIFFSFQAICIPAPEREDALTVAAAANLQSALEELKTAFEKEAEVKIKTVLGSSGRLTAQIENGAPFDVFLSADMKYPQALYQKGLSLTPPRIYAYGILVLWSTKDLDLSTGIQALTDAAGIKKIALANPELAPYGRAAVHAMKYYGLYQQLKKKLVYGESIAQVNDFIALQSADIGFTVKSTIFSPNLKSQGVWIEVSAESYDRLAQGAIVLKRAENKPLAEKFFRFLFSPEAKTIFQKYGYKRG